MKHELMKNLQKAEREIFYFFFHPKTQNPRSLQEGNEFVETDNQSTQKRFKEDEAVGEATSIFLYQYLLWRHLGPFPKGF